MYRFHPKLKAWYRFEDNTTDLSGNGNNLDAYSNVYGTGKVSRGVLLSNPYAARKTSSVVGFGSTSKMSGACWHTYNSHGGATGDYQSTVFYIMPNSRTFLAVYVYLGQIQVWGDSGSGSWYFIEGGSSTLSNGVTYHIAVSSDASLSGAARAQIWLNGVPETITQVGTLGASGSWGTATQLQVGGVDNVVRYNATMADECYLFNDFILSNADVKRLMCGRPIFGR